MGYKIAVIIVIFQLIAGLAVNILLLTNEKQYSVWNWFIAFETFCFTSLVLFAGEVGSAPWWFLCSRTSLVPSSCCSPAPSAPRQHLSALGWGSKPAEILLSLFWLPGYPFCLFTDHTIAPLPARQRLARSGPAGKVMFIWSPSFPMHKHSLCFACWGMCLCVCQIQSSHKKVEKKGGWPIPLVLFCTVKTQFIDTSSWFIYISYPALSILLLFRYPS